MRILHFFKTYYPDTTGGIEHVIHQLCQGSQPLGIDGRVLTLSRNPHPADIQVAGHPVHRSRENLHVASTGLSLQVFSDFKEMAAQVDVVHFHFPWPLMDLVHFATRHGKPSVLSYHSDIIKQRWLLQLYRPLMNRFLNDMDRILVASPNYQLTSEALKQHTDKTVVVPYGLSQANAPFIDEERLAYWQSRLPPKFFLFVGVLRYYKGLTFLLDALKDSDYPLVILGAGPEEQALKDQAQRLQLRNVTFLGRLEDEDKSCLLHLCYGMVFPSHLRSEAFGISLLEAAMHGKPMVSCEIGTGTTYVNIHEHTGLAVPPETPLALREAMTRLWNNPEEAKTFGCNAKQRFNEKFTAEQMCASTAQVYRDVLEGKKSGAF